MWSWRSSFFFFSFFLNVKNCQFTGWLCKHVSQLILIWDALNRKVIWTSPLPGWQVQQLAGPVGQDWTWSLYVATPAALIKTVTFALWNFQNNYSSFIAQLFSILRMVLLIFLDIITRSISCVTFENEGKNVFGALKLPALCFNGFVYHFDSPFYKWCP